MTRARIRWWLVLGMGVLTLVMLPLLLVAFVSVFGANWARGPLDVLAQKRTGRQLQIKGDLGLRWVDGVPRVVARDLSFANPDWAKAPRMIEADRVELALSWWNLLQGQLVIPELQLSSPRIFLEQGSGGRKTWLLDPTQTQEAARVTVGRLIVDQGEVDYTDASQDTAVHVHLSTKPPEGPAATGGPGLAAEPALVFEVRGRFRGAALDGQGRGGGALAWRDASKPYPLELRATLGDTQIRAEGTVTGLRLWTAADLHLRVQGENLAALYGVSGVLLPPTPPFQTEGRLVRAEGLWRYESFTGQIGHSTVVGTLQFRGKSSSNGGRPALTGELRFDELDLADLKPAVGARGPEAPSAAASAEAGRALPDLPLDTRHWADLDADVSLQARSLVRGRELNLHDLKTRVVLKEARLSLDPLVFAWAGGQAQGQLSLDASRQPLQGQVAMRVRGLSLRTALAPIWPASAAGGKGLGKLDADAELQGQGASVGRMLASAKGHLSLRAQGGEVSRLMMEASGLHLLEILRLKLAGDQTVAMNCAVAVFDVDQGLMRSRTLVFDTSVNSLQGSGTISLAQEQLDLTIVPRTKVNSLVALRSPVHIIGTFRKPEVRLDIPRIAARSAGAVALGLLNPLLALVPLFEAGPGVSNDCHRLLTNARAAGVPAKS